MENRSDDSLLLLLLPLVYDSILHKSLTIRISDFAFVSYYFFCQVDLGCKIEQKTTWRDAIKLGQPPRDSTHGILGRKLALTRLIHYSARTLSLGWVNFHGWERAKVAESRNLVFNL